MSPPAVCWAVCSAPVVLAGEPPVSSLSPTVNAVGDDDGTCPEYGDLAWDVSTPADVVGATWSHRRPAGPSGI